MAIPMGPELRELTTELAKTREKQREGMGLGSGNADLDAGGAQAGQAAQQGVPEGEVRKMQEGWLEKEKAYTDKISQLEQTVEEQRTKLRKYEELQKKWTQAARLDEQKMRELHGRIQQLEKEKA